MKYFSVLFVLVVLCSSSLFALSDKELAISIDLSGKQRMLTQKMTKESFLIRSNIDKKINMDKLSKSSQLFDKTLKGLMRGDSSLALVATDNQEIQAQLKKVEALWTPFYKEVQAIYSGAAKDSSYDMLEKKNMELLKEMNKAVGLYASLNKSNSKLTLANDINLAGKQRMLTQKMAKALLFANNNIKKEAYIKDFQASRKLFAETLDALYTGSKKLNLHGTNLPMITTQLDVVKKLWKEHQKVLDVAVNGAKLQEAVSGLDTILVEMNKAVILYTKSLNRQKRNIAFASLVDSFMNQVNINKKRVSLSGKQRMLTQRMTKLAILIKSNINKKSNQEKLVRFSTLYDKTLNAFKNGDKELGCIPANDKSIKEQIAVIQKAWQPFYAHIKKIINDQDSDGKSLDYVVAHNENLLAVSNELVKRYEKSNKSQNYLDKAMLHIINIAGRQRMLTQKMTKEKLLIAKGHAEYNKKLQATIKLFDDSLQALINGDPSQAIVKPTNKEIKAQLVKVSDIWATLKPIYQKEKPTTKELAVIIEKNPILLAEMHKMVNMAEQVADY